MKSEPLVTARSMLVSQFHMICTSRLTRSRYDVEAHPAMFANKPLRSAKDSEVDGEERKVQITGTPRDVHLADYLITAVQQMPRDTPQMLGLI